MNTATTTPAHAPGPWRISNDGLIHNGTVRIAQMIRRKDYESDDEANAALIASAPDLLDEVRLLRAALTEIAQRGPVQGYASASALLLRLVGTQSIARAALQRTNSASEQPANESAQGGVA